MNDPPTPPPPSLLRWCWLTGWRTGLQPAFSLRWCWRGWSKCGSVWSAIPASETSSREEERNDCHHLVVNRYTSAPVLYYIIHACEIYTINSHTAGGAVYRLRPIYGGREVHSRFSFAVRGSPSFVPRVFRSCFAVRGSCFAVRGSPSFVPRVFRSCFAVRGSRFAVICASRFSFVLRGSRFAVICASRFSFVLRGSRFAVICASHFTFVLRGSRFLIRGSYFLVRASQFAVRGSWFVVVLEQGGGSIYHRLFLRRKCAEQSECPVRRVTVDGMF